MTNHKNLAAWFFIPLILFAMLGGFAKIMTTFNHNEHMYIVAGLFVSQNKSLYKDFAYLQMPYLPLLYGGIYQIFHINSFYFLTGKLISFAALTLSALMLFLLARQVLHNRTLSLGIIAAYLLNMSIITPAAEVSNYILPIVFSFAAVYFFEISFHPQKFKPAFPVLSGLFMALAIGTKLTYASIVLPFVLSFVLIPLASRPSKPTLKQWLFEFFEFFSAWAVGLFLGLLPALIFYLQDPERFIFNNWTYHQLNTQWRWMSGFTYNMSLSSKINFAAEIMTKIENLLILAAISLGAVVSLRRFGEKPKIIFRLVFALTLLLTGLLTALAPTPSFSQYYALPVSLLFILLIYSWAAPVKQTISLPQITLIILVFITLISNGPLVLNNILAMGERENWSAVYIRDTSMKIREVLRENHLDENRKIGTLSPLFALESGLYIYPELSTGPFLYRIGDLLTADQRKQMIASSPSTVYHLFESDPPAAILVGFEEELDQPLREYAIRHQYQKIEITGFKGELYISP